MVRFVFTALLFFTAGLARAQDGILQPAPNRVDVVALMVEFQPDTTRFTTGNGTFAGPLFPGVDAPKIDPMPHNASYFHAHLRFLEHYVGRVSDGKTNVTTHLLPEVVRVSKPMGAYSPTGHEAGSDAELTKLSALVKEAWTLADQSAMNLPSGLDPATTAFVIFHAGVGRDIELVGTTLDKTPEDLPSIFFGSGTLQRLGTTGMSMDGFPITSSLIIPRTESRLGVNPLTQEPFLVELSINGMLAASFFNWLGVPDLFNTETGESAIGPFGLMDALGIFAYSGLFPPEPSAWTKRYLGWADNVSPFDSAIQRLNHTGNRDRNEQALIPLLPPRHGLLHADFAGSEYFLVENRHRDPDDDGVHLRVWTHEGEQDVVFPNGDTEFNDRTVVGFPGGVVLAVDDYDFALPGGVDENNNPLLGGILIWHVDENRLAAGLPDNRVNADPGARAIDLEEADGAQDIGFGSGGGFFSANFDLGTPFDFWFEGNPVTVRTSSGQDIRLYQNRFADDTEPASGSNGGGLSGLTLSDFSAVGPVMTFTTEYRTAGALEFLGQPFLGGSEPLEPSRPSALIPDAVLPEAWAWYGTTWLSHEFCFGQTANIQPAAIDEGLFVISDSGISLFTGNQCVETHLMDFPAGSRTWTTQTVSWVRLPGEVRLRAGVQDAQGNALLTFILHDDGRFEMSRTALGEPVRFIFEEGRTRNDALLVTDTGMRNEQGDLLLPVDLHGVQEAAMAGSSSLWTLAWTSVSDQNVIHVVSSEGNRLTVHPSTPCSPRFPAWRDLDGDDQLDLSFACGSSIMAVHHSGAVLDGFPLGLSAEPASQPVFALGEEGGLVMVVVTAKGQVEGRVRSGQAWGGIPGFPVSIGTPSSASVVLRDDYMWILDARGGWYLWRFRATNATQAWEKDLMIAEPERDLDPEAGSRLLVGSETYNWPNPITNGSTRLRVEVQETSRVDIDIVDASGMRVDHLEVDAAPGGVPTEIIWQTDAGSGVYLARIKARALSSGRTDARLIRMAIIR